METSSQSIRKAFLDFFRSKEHCIVPSSPMVVKNDPTLMFTNAGMNQFKDIFLGNTPRKFPRVADTQKCLRVSGKHNDLEEVGHDTYHHTMFEMLGNWSFGDYFKKESIAWAWEFLTEVMHIDKDRLYVTVFGGDAGDKTEKDTEALGFWSEHIAKDRILFGNKHDNFWEMGDTGPCGPCSEIHVDIRSQEERARTDARDLINKDHPQVIEIWNLVFMQFNRMADGHLEELPSKCIDTGMGFERLCMVVQGKQSNYDTDVFQPLIGALAQASGIAYGKDPQRDIAMRVIADHARAVSFAIADGQLPSNNKAGYVIRRILRRAVRYGCSFLGFNEPFICHLVDVLVKQMGEHFPELAAQQDLIKKVIAEEESTFLKTLETGNRLLGQLCEKLKAEGKDTLSGVDAFTLYDTYGFPLDLTELMLREQHLKVDQTGFEAEMLKQKNRSRTDAAVTSDDWVVLEDKKSEFVGYDLLETKARILRYRKVNKKGKDLYQLVLSPTPFYAESGGQTGDRGFIEDLQGNERIPVLDTVKENNMTIHWTAALPAEPTHDFRAVVDMPQRIQTARNHSCTHLMHYALRQVLGAHVEQKGSLVNEMELRFDFSHFQKMSREEIRQVEKMVNRLIRRNIPLDEHRELPIEEARKMGAMALFSEKYGDKVRVVRYGESVEFCGGTHVAATGQIGMFKILSEGAVAAGIRRITAVCGRMAEECLYRLADQTDEIRETFKAGSDILGHIHKLLEGNQQLKKEVETFFNERIAQLHDNLLARKTVIDGVPVIFTLRGDKPDVAKAIAMSFKKELPDGLALIAGVWESRPYIQLMLGEELTKKGLHAGNIIKEACRLMGGSGGGQPGFASGSGSEADRLMEALKAIAHLLGLNLPLE
ncbi:MAG: alanine--tRNA ligase [Bacteroidales bacterium]|nr:alanine--tRNA ligase [Bacteroidales bacterium]